MTARIDCPKTSSVGPVIPITFTGNAVTMTAADATNFNSVKVSNAPFVLLIDGGAAGGTYTIQSIADPQGRTGDLTTITIGVYAKHALYFTSTGLGAGWAQSDGTLWIKGSVSTILFGVIQLPG